MAVTNSNHTVIGVLTATSTDENRTGLATHSEASEVLSLRSMKAARILVDLFGWFADDYTEA